MMKAKKIKVSDKDDQDKRRPSLLKQVLVGLGAVIATGFFGIAVSIFALWLSVRLIEKPGGEYLSNDGAKLAFLFAVISGIVVYLTLHLVRKGRQKLFFGAVSIVMLCGLCLIGLIGIGSLIGLNNVSQIESSEKCTTLSKQYTKAISATMPIATNLGSGTAFAIDSSGHYLTAYHVVEGASEVFLNLTTGKQMLSVERSSPDYDIALLKGPVQSNYLNLTTTFAQTDEVYAIGYPGNAFTAGGASISRGIISRVLSNEDLRLTNDSMPVGMELVQTDAAVNPGNSGGPLVGRCGVVGIVSAMSDKNRLGDYGFVSEQGISYAVSTTTIQRQLNLSVVTH